MVSKGKPVKWFLLSASLLSTLFSSTLLAEMINGSSVWVESGAKYVSGEMLVKFKPGASVSRATEINARYGCSVLAVGPYSRISRLAIPEARTVPEMVEIYRQDPNVEYVQPNYICRVFWTPDDTSYSYQWHFDASHINMPAAWDLDTTVPLYGGDDSIVVAVIDTGVAYRTGGGYTQAPDLASTNFVAGYDYVNSDAFPDDDHYHGTHVCGTIAQSTDNSLGVAGMAFNCSIMPIKVLAADGTGTAAMLINGLDYATTNGAEVINLSLGFDGDPGTLVHEAIQRAYDAGIVIVAATGNDDASSLSYPAAYSECIAVGAIRWDDARAPYSNYGTGIDIVAPGGDTTVDQNSDGYGDGVLQNTHSGVSPYDDFAYYFFQGTSMATPHVAGLAALLLSRDSTLTEVEVRSRILDYAQDLGTAGYDTVFGYGSIDPPASLQANIYKFAFTTSSQTLTAGTGGSTYTIQSQDAADSSSNVTQDTTVYLSSSSSGASFSSDGGGTWTATSITISNGANSATFDYKDTTAGTPTITASDASPVNGTTGINDATQLQTVNPAAATKLGYTVQPVNTNHGATITPAVKVAVQDTYGNTITSDSATSITIAITTNPSAGTLSGTLARTVFSGIATFNDLSIDETGTGYTLGATVTTGLTSATSNTFNITVPGASGGGGGGGGCFIATAAYSGEQRIGESENRGRGESHRFTVSPFHPVNVLQRFRDERLLTNPPGRAFISAYHKVSSPVADFIYDKEFLKAITRTYLKPVVWAANKLIRK